MHHIEIETVWRFHKEGSPQTAVVMLGILNEIRKTGKLTSAAELPVIRRTPGVSENDSSRRSRSRGQNPLSHLAQ